MSYEDVVSDVVKVIEGFGAGIMVVGGLVALGRYRAMWWPTILSPTGSFGRVFDARFCLGLRS